MLLKNIKRLLKLINHTKQKKMKNLLEKVKEFIKRELDNTTTNPEHSFMSGYRTALIDVRDYINNNEKEQNLIGKWGYFWDNENTGVQYGKLIKIKDEDENDEIYVNGFHQFAYKNFSLTIPKHCK